MYFGGEICKSIVLNVKFEKRDRNDEKLKRKIKGISKKFYQSVWRKKRYFIQELMHRAVFEVEIRSFILGKRKIIKGAGRCGRRRAW